MDDADSQQKCKSPCHSLHCGVQANLEKEVEREKALAEAEGRIRENRQNEDVNRRAMQLRLEEERKKLVEAINTTFTNIGTGSLALLTDKERLGTAVAGLTILALGVYSAREGTRVAGQVFSRYAVTFLTCQEPEFCFTGSRSKSYTTCLQARLWPL